MRKFFILVFLLAISCEKPEPTRPEPTKPPQTKPEPTPDPTQPLPTPDPTVVSAKMDLFKSSNLRGANMYQQENHSSAGQVWNPNIDQRDLNGLKAAGANFVNYSVPGIYDVKKYSLRTDAEKKLDGLVNMASKAGLYIVIAYRTGPGRGEGNITKDGLSNKELYSSAQAQQAFIDMWKYTANKYKGHKNIAAYDILVEPNGVNVELWSSIAERVVAAIRSVDSTTPIIVPVHNWSVVSSLSSFKPVKGSNLVYAIHQYEPYTYSHDGEGSSGTKQLPSLYKKISDWMKSNNSIVVVNEFGCKNEVTNCDLFIAEQINLLESLGISHAGWIWEVEYDSDYDYQEFDFKDNKKIFDVYKKSWLKNTNFPQ